MTTYVLSLAGNERKAADATQWARYRSARLLSISRNPAARALADGAADRRSADDWPGARDAATLAALLLRTLDVQDGSGVVLADFDSDDVAADVVARMVALGRDVTLGRRRPRFSFG